MWKTLLYFIFGFFPFLIDDLQIDEQFKLKCPHVLYLSFPKTRELEQLWFEGKLLYIKK